MLPTQNFKAFQPLEELFNSNNILILQVRKCGQRFDDRPEVTQGSCAFLLEQSNSRVATTAASCPEPQPPSSSLVSTTLVLSDKKEAMTKGLTRRSYPLPFRRGPGLFRIPNDFSPGPGPGFRSRGGALARCERCSKAPGGHGNMGPASCAAMVTGSPGGGRQCPSERAGGALWGEGPGGRCGCRGGGRGCAAVSAWSATPGHGSHLAGHPPRLPGVSHGQRTVIAPRGAALPTVSTDSSPLPGQPSAVPGDPESRAHSLGPARRPRKCWAPAKPRPAPPRPCLRELSAGRLRDFPDGGRAPCPTTATSPGPRPFAATLDSMPRPPWPVGSASPRPLVGPG